MFDPLIKEIQRRLELLRAAFHRLELRVAAIEQSIAKNWGLNSSVGGGGGAGNVFFALTPSSGSWVGTALPGGAPGSFTADVYKIAGGAYVLVTTAATIYNGYLSSPGHSKMITVVPNGDGTYSLIAESCL